MKLSVIIPVFNEEKTVAQTINKVLEEKTDKEIIIVDDGSTDKSVEIIKELFINGLTDYQLLNTNHQLPTTIKLIKNEKNLGKGSAVRKGIAEASGDTLIIQDSDLEYDPKYYKELMEPMLKNGVKVVYGTRLKTLKFVLIGPESTPFPLHFLVNRFLSMITNLIYESKLTDMETGYKLMTKEVYKKLNLKANGFDIEPEITAKILKKGYKITEVPIETKPRGYKDGKKIRARDAFWAIFALFKYRLID